MKRRWLQKRTKKNIFQQLTYVLYSVDPPRHASHSHLHNHIQMQTSWKQINANIELIYFVIIPSN